MYIFIIHVFDHRGVTGIIVGSTIQLCILRCSVSGAPPVPRLAAINDLLTEHNRSLTGKSTLKSVRAMDLEDKYGCVMLRGKW